MLTLCQKFFLTDWLTVYPWCWWLWMFCCSISLQPERCLLATHNTIFIGDLCIPFIFYWYKSVHLVVAQDSFKMKHIGILGFFWCGMCGFTIEVYWYGSSACTYHAYHQKNPITDSWSDICIADKSHVSNPSVNYVPTNIFLCVLPWSLCIILHFIYLWRLVL